MSDVVIPSSPEDRKNLKTMIVEMTNAMLRIDNEKEHLKSIAEDASEKFDVPKKLVNKIARTMYKHNYEDLQAENEAFEGLYETLVNAKGPAPAESSVE